MRKLYIGWGTTSITMDPAVAASRSDFFRTPNLDLLMRQLLPWIKGVL